MKWQVRIDKIVMYLEPSEVSITMENAVLMNHRNVAQRIYDGENKTVCAWVRCTAIHINPSEDGVSPNGWEVKFNPRVLPYWADENGVNLDRSHHAVLTTHGKKVFTSAQ